MLRLDLIFSNWIFVWFVLFFIGVVQYNPTFVLVAAFCFIAFEVFYLWYIGANEYNITKMIVLNIMLKNIPILLLWTQKKLSIAQEDIYFTMTIFVIYNIYLQLNGTDIVVYYNKVLRNYVTTYISAEITDPTDKTIISATYDYVYHKLQIFT